LDPLIKTQFAQTFERDHEISAILKLRNRIDYEININDKYVSFNENIPEHSNITFFDLNIPFDQQYLFEYLFADYFGEILQIRYIINREE
jgi:hypothetical protein